MYHPWRVFRALANWQLAIAWLPIGILGLTDYDTRTVTLAEGLGQAERRSTLAHELEHIARGWTPCTTREECAVDRIAARKLIEIRDLGEALAWTSNRDEAAEELWVDTDMLNVRLANLHPAEHHYLRRRLGVSAEDGGVS